MTEKQREAKREYMKNYRLLNPDQHRNWTAENTERVQANEQRRPSRRKYHRDRMRRLRAEYPDKERAKINKHHAANPDKRRDATRKATAKRLGHAPPPREKDCPPRPKTCQCCGKRMQSNILHLDHDHSTGSFRGWICGHCNRGLGLFGDTINGLRKALAYASNWKA